MGREGESRRLGQREIQTETQTTKGEKDRDSILEEAVGLLDVPILKYQETPKP